MRNPGARVIQNVQNASLSHNDFVVNGRTVKLESFAPCERVMPENATFSDSSENKSKCFNLLSILESTEMTTSRSAQNKTSLFVLFGVFV